MKLSVVSPVYMGESMVHELVERLSRTLSAVFEEYEIILVEDGSPDGSWEKIKTSCKNNNRVRGIKLSRNFGQHYAISAGLNEASGDWIVVMDCDLQDRPEEIIKLYKKAIEGYDIVYAQRKLRQDDLLKRLSSKLFYSIFGYLTETKQDSSIANFGIYHKKVIEATLSMKDCIRYFPTMIRWVGFDSTNVEVQHDRRKEGNSSYSWNKLLKLAINNIIAFSDKPLRILVKIGFLLSATSFFLGLFYIYQFFSGRILIMGFTSVILTITFLSGLIIIILGFIGIYLGKTFEQTKQRPTYIICDKLNADT